MEDYIPFSKFWTQRNLLLGAVLSVTTPLEFSYGFKETEQIFTICFFYLRVFVEFLCVHSACKTVELSHVPPRPSAAPPATLSVSWDKYQRLFHETSD